MVAELLVVADGAAGSEAANHAVHAAVESFSQPCSERTALALATLLRERSFAAHAATGRGVELLGRAGDEARAAEVSVAVEERLRTAAAAALALGGGD
jgi:hypothetical protein